VAKNFFKIFNTVVLPELVSNLKYLVKFKEISYHLIQIVLGTKIMVNIKSKKHEMLLFYTLMRRYNIDDLFIYLLIFDIGNFISKMSSSKEQKIKSEYFFPFLMLSEFDLIPNKGLITCLSMDLTHTLPRLPDILRL